MPYKRRKSADTVHCSLGTEQPMSQDSVGDEELVDVILHMGSQQEHDKNPDDPMEEEVSVSQVQATPVYQSQSAEGPASGAHESTGVIELDSSSQPPCSQRTAFCNLECKPKRSIKHITTSPLADATLWSEFSLYRAEHNRQLLIIPSDLYDTMYCKSKSLHVEHPPAQTEEEGVELSFVFEMVSAGLPQEALKVLYFFSKVLAASRTKPLNGFCVATDTLKPQVSMPHQKITHIVSEIPVEEVGENMMEDQEIYGGDEGINLEKLIASEDLNTEGVQKRRVPILSICVCITGAVCQLQNGDIKHFPVCNVRVKFLTNINFLPYIVDYLFAYNSNSAEARREHSEMSELLLKILFYQSSCIIGVKSSKLPSDYYSDPTGMLGISTICHPLMDPLKITSMVRKAYPTVSSLKIIGFYDIDWLGNPSADRQLNAYMRYYHAYSSEVHKLYKEIEEALKAIQAEGRSKKKRSRKFASGAKGKQQQQQEETEQEEAVAEQEEGEKTFQFTPLFGYPLTKEATDDGKCYFVSFLQTLYPIQMRYMSLEHAKKSSLEQFIMDFGTLPLAVSSALMDFRLFDYQFPDASGISEFTLVDPEPASMEKVIKKYYSNDSRSLDGLVMPDCLKSNYTRVVEFLKLGLQSGESSPESVIQTFHKCDVYCSETYEAMVYMGLWQSQSIDNKRDMIQNVTKAENNPKNPLKLQKELKSYMRHVMGARYNAKNNNAIDPFVEATEFLFGSLVDANRSMHLNSINLKTYLAILISILHYAMPTSSSTVPGFGQGIFVTPACGTLSELTSNKQLMPVVGCPNSTGKDFVANMVTRLYKNLAVLLDSPEFDIIQQLARSTAGSLEDAVSVTFADGKIVKLPNVQVHGTFFMDTELRGSDLVQLLTSIVNLTAARGQGQKRSTMTTTLNVDTGFRSTNTRYPCMPVSLGYMCTNQKAQSDAVAELLATLGCVSYMAPPGSNSQPPEAKSNSFADVAVSCAQTRSSNFEGEAARGAPLALGLSHLLAFMKVNLPLWAGAGPLNISPVVISVLDFMTFYIKKHLLQLFHPRNGAQNFQRLEAVHTAKGSVFTSWTLVLQGLLESKDKEQACKEARRKFMFDGLALTNVPFVGYELICRLLHWGPVIMACLFIKEVDMPIVPIDVLVALLRSDSKPTHRDGELYSNYMKIHRWLVDCVDAGRFCPPSGCDQCQSVCEYISSGCAPGGGSFESSDLDHMFRVGNVPNGWKTITEQGKERTENIFEKLGANILSLHRRELIDGCSFTEGSIQVIVRDMTTNFSVWLPKFLEIPQSETDRFLRFFDVSSKHSFVPYKPDRDCSPPFAIKTAWFSSASEAESAGIGVNVIQLLILGSLAGDAAKDLAHPNMVYALSKGLLKSILERMPGGAVPRKHVYIPSFSPIRNETIVIRAPTIEHFVRPKDVQLALTGKPSHFPNICNRFAPEDVLHMPGLCSVAEYFGFNVVDCPAAVNVNYHIRNKYYCAFNKEKDRLGLLSYNGKEVNFCHFRNRYNVSASAFSDDEDEDEDDRDGPLYRKKIGSSSSLSQDHEAKGSELNDSQPMERDGSGDEDDDDEEEEDEREVRLTFRVRTWQTELRELGFILLPMINRPGACVLVDNDAGKRVGVLVPPPDAENADGNFHIKKRCYYVSVVNRRATNFVLMTPFEVFDSLIPIGTVLYLRLESRSAVTLRDYVSLGDADPSRTVIRVVMGSPNVFEPEKGMAFVNYLILHGDQKTQKTEVISVHPSDLLVDPDDRRVIPHVFA